MHIVDYVVMGGIMFLMVVIIYRKMKQRKKECGCSGCSACQFKERCEKKEE